MKDSELCSNSVNALLAEIHRVDKDVPEIFVVSQPVGELLVQRPKANHVQFHFERHGVLGDGLLRQKLRWSERDLELTRVDLVVHVFYLVNL